jgi:hypothetical protein
MAATSSANEGNTGTAAANIVVALSTASGRDVSVLYLVTGGTASNPVDYTIAASPITIPAGMTSANIVVTVKGDTLDEANETVIVGLSTPTNATLGATTTHTLTINDDDASPTVKFSSATANQNEATTDVTVNVVLSAVSGRSVTVPYSINASSTASDPADYTIAPATPLTIPAGQTTATITISVADDLLDEADETITLDLDTPTNATLATPASYTLTIKDNEAAPNVSWNSAESDLSEAEGTGPGGGPTRNVTYTVVLSAASTTNVVVPLAYSGTATPVDDYTGPASVTITAGNTSANVTLTIVKDNIKENGAAETIIIDIVSNSVTGATAKNPLTRTYSIQDDD